MPHPHDDDRQQRDRQHDLRQHDEGGDHPGPRGPVPARAAVAAAEDRARAHASAPRTEAQDSAAGDETAAADDSHIALVDGSNVAHSSEGEKARLRNIELVCDKLIEEGLQPIVVTDAALRHQIDETDEYERLIESGKIKQAPAGTDADYFILAFARELDAAIVSNDRFRDRASAFPEARDRAIRYMIVNDEVVLERRTRRR
ncbi:MAG TPA: hypothetical protein VFH27_14725 [Longimicrobiaceae bacterium]|nr:hypothetical protein [Longimicrobiaceae bacterium]